MLKMSEKLLKQPGENDVLLTREQWFKWLCMSQKQWS